MKKKVLVGILIGLVVLAVGATSAFAAGTGGWHHLSGGRGSCDGTGICTNCGSTGCHGSCYVDDDNDGICDNCGTNCRGTGCGLGYVDADNDGVCDNYASGGQGSGCGSGWGYGSGRGGHHGGHHS